MSYSFEFDKIKRMKSRMSKESLLIEQPDHDLIRPYDYELDFDFNDDFAIWELEYILKK